MEETEGSIVETSDVESGYTASPAPLRGLSMLMRRGTLQDEEVDSPVWPVMRRFKRLGTENSPSKDEYGRLQQQFGDGGSDAANIGSSESEPQSEIIAPLANLNSLSNFPGSRPECAGFDLEENSGDVSKALTRRLVSPAFSFESQSSHEEGGGLVSQCMDLLSVQDHGATDSPRLRTVTTSGGIFLAPQPMSKLQTEDNRQFYSQSSQITIDPTAVTQMDPSQAADGANLDLQSIYSDVTMDPTAEKDLTQLYTSPNDTQSQANSEVICSLWDRSQQILSTIQKQTTDTKRGKRPRRRTGGRAATEQEYSVAEQEASLEGNSRSPHTPPDQYIRKIHDVSSPTMKSFVWKHFGFYKSGGAIEGDRTICKLCREALKYNVTQRSTSTMRLHIQKKHPHLWEDGHSTSSGDSSGKKNPARAKRKLMVTDTSDDDTPRKETKRGRKPGVSRGGVGGGPPRRTSRSRSSTSSQSAEVASTPPTQGETSSSSESSDRRNESTEALNVLQSVINDNEVKVETLNKHEREANRLKYTFMELQSGSSHLLDLDALHERTELLKTHLQDIFQGLFSTQRKIIEITKAEKRSKNVVQKCDIALELHRGQTSKYKVILGILQDVGNIKKCLPSNNERTPDVGHGFREEWTGNDNTSLGESTVVRPNETTPGKESSLSQENVPQSYAVSEARHTMPWMPEKRSGVGVSSSNDKMMEHQVSSFMEDPEHVTSGGLSYNPVSAVTTTTTASLQLAHWQMTQTSSTTNDSSLQPMTFVPQSMSPAPPLPQEDTENLTQSTVFEMPAIAVQQQPRKLVAPSILSLNSSPEAVQISSKINRKPVQTPVEIRKTVSAVAEQPSAKQQVLSQTKKQSEYPDLQHLLDTKAIAPGTHVMSLDYGDKTFVASLLDTGVILGNGGEQFNPMSWFRACTGAAVSKKKDVYCKVCYRGKPLISYKQPADTMCGILNEIHKVQTTSYRGAAAGRAAVNAQYDAPPVTVSALASTRQSGADLVNSSPMMPQTSSVHNQVYLVNISNPQKRADDPLLCSEQPLINSHSVRQSPTDQQPQQQLPEVSDDRDDSFDLSVYLGSMTHVNLIHDNELLSYGQPVTDSFDVIPQSVIDDLQSW